MQGQMRADIWHNPACGTSRNTLELIHHAGVEPMVFDYLQAPLEKPQLERMIAAAGLSVRNALRSKEPEFLALGLDNVSLDDDALLDAMLANRVLINRPLVATPLGTRMCRPSEMVLDILPPCGRRLNKAEEPR